MSTATTNRRTISETGRFTYQLPGDLTAALKKAQAEWDDANKTQRLWARDATLWTGADEAKWLGWLDIVDRQLAGVSKFQALAAEVAEDAFKNLLLLGMGGSSLCPEVFSLTYGKQAGFPQLLVLDSTDPAQIRSVHQKIDPARTLFCVSSKSGTTLEPNIYLQYFFDQAKKAVGDRAGNHFIAVTDPGSQLEGMAEKLGFRRLYHGDPAIGGRYSALSDFGMIPHAAAGLDSEKFLLRAKEMADACKNSDASQNPGVQLGLILGAAATQCKRDKLTLICSPAIHDLGAWLEQLLAESTGKQGRGLIPVDREPAVSPSDYGSDRIFVYIQAPGDRDAKIEAHVADIEKAAQPVIRIVLRDLASLGQIFFQWEIATAVAGSVIGIDAFNQPDVEASKIVTRDLTSAFEKTGSLPAEKPILEQDGLKLFTDQANAAELTGEATTIGGVIRRHLDRIKPGDYFALLAFLPMFPEHENELQKIRKDVLEAKQVATVLGFGPRFLHSTGQAYKGGPNSGVFLQITCDDANDLAVPLQKYTFGVVKAAQARGDFKVLADRHRRALRVHLGSNVARDLHRLRDLVCAAISH